MNLRINNAWICSVKKDEVIPQFADLIIREGIIEKIIPGQNCEIILDAYPDKGYPGFVFKIVPKSPTAHPIL